MTSGKDACSQSNWIPRSWDGESGGLEKEVQGEISAGYTSGLH